MKTSFYNFCVEQKKPELLNQWHHEKNGELSPESVTYGSKKKLWWRCEKGHEWQAAVFSRSEGRGCPYCTNRKVFPGFNDLATQNPVIAAQWHPTKNQGLMPDQVLEGSQKLVWWRCEKGHEWEARIQSRHQGNGCPICAGKIIRIGENDLAATHPVLALQWHPTKNAALQSSGIVAGSCRKVWWLCEKGHEWQAAVFSRASNGSGCPVCAGKKVIAGENDLVSQRGEIAAQWHPTKNDFSPESVSVYSNKKVWWLCEKGHEYAAMISDRTGKGGGCPYCANRKVLPGFNDLASQEPELAKQWHSTLNGALTPERVTTGSHKKVWWECPNGHVWKAIIYSRAGKGKRSGCPVCAGKAKENRQQRYEKLIALGK